METHHIVNRARGVGWPALHDPDVNSLRVDEWCHVVLTEEPHNGKFAQARIDRAFAAFGAWRAGR